MRSKILLSISLTTFIFFPMQSVTSDTLNVNAITPHATTGISNTADKYGVSIPSNTVSINSTTGNIIISNPHAFNITSFITSHWIGLITVASSMIALGILTPTILLPIIKNLLNLNPSLCDPTSGLLSPTPLTLSSGVSISTYKTLCHLMLYTSSATVYECIDVRRKDLRSAAVICDTNGLLYMKANGTSMCGCNQFVCYNSSGICRGAELFPDIICPYNDTSNTLCNFSPYSITTSPSTPLTTLITSSNQKSIPLQSVSIPEYIERIPFIYNVICSLFDLQLSYGYSKRCYFAKEMAPSAIAYQIADFSGDKSFGYYYSSFIQYNADVGNWMASFEEIPLLGYINYYGSNTHATNSYTDKQAQSIRPFYAGFTQWILYSYSQKNTTATICDQKYSNSSCAEFNLRLYPCIKIASNSELCAKN